MIDRLFILPDEEPCKFKANCFLLILLQLVTAMPLSGQAFSISGKVRELERNTGAALQEVRIDVDSSRFIAFTDANGNYSISGIPSGTHSIRISKPGFIGVFRKDYTLDGNKTFDVSLADTVQESPAGTQVLKLDEYRTKPPWEPAYTGLHAVDIGYPNSLTWNGVTEGNLIPILLKNANSSDSLAFRNAIGACNGNWQNSPDGSAEKLQKRALFILSNDPEISYTKRGIRVSFHASYNKTTILAYESNPSYIYKAEVNLAVTLGRIIKKEVLGRCFLKQDIFYRPSYMNSSSVDMTDQDHMLNIVFFNQWAAIARNEQNSNILDMDNTPTFTAPSATSITAPANNASNLEKSVRIQYNNIFGTDEYQLQIAGNESFSNILRDLEVMRNDTVLAFDPHTTYYARVRPKNSKGTAPWSPTVKFTTKNILPAVPVTNKPTNGQTLDASNYQNGLLILQYTTTAKDADNDNVTTTFIVTGPNVNKTFVSTTGGQATQTIDSLLFQPDQTYNTSISATDGIGTVNGVSTTFKTAAKLNNPPAIPVTNSPTNGQTLNKDNYLSGKLILKYTTTARDADNEIVTTTFIVTGPNVNKTFVSTQDGQITQTIDSILFQPDQTYNTSISATDGKATVNGTGTTFRTAKLNTPPTAFMFIRPANNTTIAYVNGKLEIETSIPTDVDGDALTKRIRLYSPAVKDTLMLTPGTTQVIYLDSARLKLDTEFTLTGEVTDGKAATLASNNVTFRTPKPLGIDDTVYEGFKAYPVPVRDYLNIEYDPNTEATRRIISLDGKLMDSRDINSETKETIDMTRYTPGLYVLQVLGDNINRRIIISKPGKSDF